MKFYLLSFIIGCINSACLSPEILKQLGWNPLSSPKEISNPSICKNTYNESKACVDQDQFSTFMKNFQKNLNEKRKDAYKELNERVKSISEKLNLLKTKLVEKNSFQNKPLNNIGMARLDEALKWVPENPSEFSDKQKVHTKDCIRAQNQISLGTFCILSSDEASNYVSQQSNTDTGIEQIKQSTPIINSQTTEGAIVNNQTTVNETTNNQTTNNETTNNETTNNETVNNQTTNNEVSRRLETNVTTETSLTSPLVFKVNQNTADFINMKCSDLLRGSCMYKKANEALSSLEGSTAEITTGCYPELLTCELNPSNCSSKAKNYSLQHFFKPFSDNFLNEKDINSADSKLISEVGSLWDKTKNKAGSLTETITGKTGDLTDKAKDLFNNLQNKVQGNRRLSSSESRIHFILRKLGEIQSNEVSYYVTSNGADIVSKGASAGITISSSVKNYTVISLLFAIVMIF